MGLLSLCETSERTGSSLIPLFFRVFCSVVSDNILPSSQMTNDPRRDGLGSPWIYSMRPTRVFGHPSHFGTSYTMSGGNVCPGVNVGPVGAFCNAQHML